MRKILLKRSNFIFPLQQKNENNFFFLSNISQFFCYFWQNKHHWIKWPIITGVITWLFLIFCYCSPRSFDWKKIKMLLPIIFFLRFTKILFYMLFVSLSPSSSSLELYRINDLPLEQVRQMLCEGWIESNSNIPRQYLSCNDRSSSRFSKWV